MKRIFILKRATTDRVRWPDISMQIMKEFSAGPTHSPVCRPR